MQDSVADLVSFAASGVELSPVDRVQRTIDGYLRYAEHNQAAFRTIVSGGVGFDTEVHAVRDGVRAAIVATIAEGAYGRGDIPALPRMGLLAGCAVWRGPRWSGSTAPNSPRSAMCDLLVRTLGGTLRAIEEMEPAFTAPEPARRDA